MYELDQPFLRYQIRSLCELPSGERQKAAVLKVVTKYELEHARFDLREETERYAKHELLEFFFTHDAWPVKRPIAQWLQHDKREDKWVEYVWPAKEPTRGGPR